MAKNGETLFQACLVRDAKFIDEGIKPLVASICGYGGIVTTSSCEGHEKKRDYRAPYVVFMNSGLSKKDFGLLVREFWEKLEGTKWGVFRNDKGYALDRKDRRSRPAFTLRPYKRAKRTASIREVAEIIKAPNPRRAWVLQFEYGEDGSGRVVSPRVRG